MLCRLAAMGFLIPLDCLIVWFIFSFVFFFFLKKKNRTSWARCFKEWGMLRYNIEVNREIGKEYYIGVNREIN
jgi:hypothetical protein